VDGLINNEPGIIQARIFQMNLARNFMMIPGSFDL